MSQQDPWIKVKFNFAGKDQMIRAIHNLDNHLTSFRPFLEKVADDIYDTTKAVFETEGREINKPWKPLSPGYAAAKAEQYPGRGILERTGKFKRSVTERSDTNAICIIEDNKLIIGSKVTTENASNIPLLTLHQYGWNKPEIVPRIASSLRWGSSDEPVFSKKSRAVHVDARPIFWADGDKRETWMRLLQTHIHDVLEESSTARRGQR